MKLLALAFLCSLLAGCSTRVLPYEGGQVVTGSGGARETRDGIDLWTDGTPPRRYRVIAIIHDKRPHTLIGMSTYKHSLVNAAKEAHGDAVIMMNEHTEYAGMIGGDNGVSYTSGASYHYGATTVHQSYTVDTSSPAEPVFHHVATAAVIHYEQ